MNRWDLGWGGVIYRMSDVLDIQRLPADMAKRIAWCICESKGRKINKRKI